MKLEIIIGVLLFASVVKSEGNDTTDKTDTDTDTDTDDYVLSIDAPTLEEFGMETVCFNLMHSYRAGYRCLKSNREIENITYFRDKCFAVLWNIECFQDPEHKCRNGMWISGLLHENQLILDDRAIGSNTMCRRARSKLEEFIDPSSPVCTKMYQDIAVCNSAFMRPKVRQFAKYLKIESIFQFSPVLHRDYVCKTLQNIDQEKMKQCFTDAEVNRCFAGKSPDKPTEILQRIQEYCHRDCHDYDKQMNRLKNCPYGLPDKVSTMLLLMNNSAVPEYLKKYDDKGFDCQPIKDYIEETGECINENIGDCKTLAFLMRRVGQFIRSSAIFQPVPLLRKAITKCEITLPFDFYSHGCREYANIWLIIHAAFLLIVYHRAGEI